MGKGSFVCPSPLSPRRVSEESFKQVFWLPDQSISRTFPFIYEQWSLRVSFPVTAAGPQRNFTVFTYLNEILECPGELNKSRRKVNIYKSIKWDFLGSDIEKIANFL